MWRDPDDTGSRVADFGDVGRGKIKLGRDIVSNVALIRNAFYESTCAFQKALSKYTKVRKTAERFVHYPRTEKLTTQLNYFSRLLC